MQRERKDGRKFIFNALSTMTVSVSNRELK